MDIKRILVVTVLGLILPFCGANKNVLFLVSDDMRQEIGAYLGPYFPSPVHPKMHTPSLDALASKSLLLKRAYVQQALCSPSRTALLTGRRPDTTHVYDLDHYFRKVGGNFTTLPEYFKQNGYSTIGMGKIFHPGKAASDFDDPISWTEPYYHGVANFENTGSSWLAVPDDQLKHKPLIDRQIADHAISTLRKVAPAAKSGEKNFFVAVGFHKPHLPFVFPASFMNDFYPRNAIKLPPNPYAPVNMPDVAWFKYTVLNRFKDIRKLNISGGINTTLPEDTVLELRRAYYSALSWTDSLVGEVISELDRLGLSNDTIVSFWGDHGWQLGEHGEWCKQTNFELATHAPMMIHIPGLTDTGIETDQLTEFVDLYPTLAEAAGLEPLPLCPEVSADVQLCREGTSLMPLIENPKTPIKTAAFSQYPRETNIMGYTMRTDRYRYTEWAEFTYAPQYMPNWNRLAGVELYDHLNDPAENYNRALDPKYEKTKKELSQMLHEGWRGAEQQEMSV
ncbi:hypothetical protein ACF0H5_000470 [Mactra antiquata]